jgi:transcriptional regulator with XRE-family HTH domain
MLRSLDRLSLHRRRPMDDPTLPHFLKELRARAAPPRDLSLARFFQALRRRAKLSQVDVSYRAGLSETYYGKIESGERRPSGTVLMHLLAVLGCSPEDKRQAVWLFTRARFPNELLAELDPNPTPPARPAAAPIGTAAPTPAVAKPRRRRRGPALGVALALSGSLLGQPLGIEAARPDNGQTGGILSPRRRAAEAAEAGKAA